MKPSALRLIAFVAYLLAGTGAAAQSFGVASAESRQVIENATSEILHLAQGGAQRFESEQACLRQLQILVNQGALVAGQMPFSRVWAIEDDSGLFAQFRLLIGGQRLHLRAACDGPVLAGRSLDWNAPMPFEPPYQASTDQAVDAIRALQRLDPRAADTSAMPPNPVARPVAPVTSRSPVARIPDVPVATPPAPTRPAAAPGFSAPQRADPPREVPNAPATGLSAADKSFFASAFGLCWVFNPTAPAARVRLTLGVTMTISGNIAGINLVEASGGTEPQVDLAYQAALSAITQCADLTPALPPELYDEWRMITLAFDGPTGQIRWQD